MTSVKTPVLPPELESFYNQDQSLQAMHEELSSYKTWREYQKNSPIPHIEYDPDLKTSFMDFIPKEDHDHDKVVVVEYPFANGAEAKHIQLRVAALQKGLDQPTRIIAFPNTTFMGSFNLLSKSERRDVAEGYFSPIGDKQVKILEKLRIAKFGLFGGSQGASVGLSTLNIADSHGTMEIGPSGLFEPVNNQTRVKKQLRQDFTSPGLEPMKKATNESGIELLNKTLHTRGGLDTFRLLIGTAIFGLGTLTADNRAYNKSFLTNTFGYDVYHYLQFSNNLSRLTIANVSTSLIAPTASIDNNFSSLKTYLADDIFKRLVRVEISSPNGHAWENNIIAFATLGKISLSNRVIAEADSPTS